MRSAYGSRTQSFVVAMLGFLAASGCNASVSEPRLAPRADEVPAEREIVCSSAADAGVGRVVLRGASDRSACALIRSMAGRPEDARTIERDIEALFASAAYADVVALREEGAGGTDLVFELEERPRVSAVTLDGLRSEASRAALAGFELAAPKQLDPVWVRRSEQRLVAALELDGFRSATVQAAIANRSGRETSVRFVIDEGPQAVLSRVTISGLRTAQEKVVRVPLRLTPGAPAPPGLVERDELVLSSTLYDLGLLASKVESTLAVSDDGTQVEVTFRVVEGPVYRLRSVQISGNEAVDPKLYAPTLATVKRGAIFSRTAMLAIESKLETVSLELGKPVDVEPRLEIDERKLEVSVTFVVTPR